VLEMFVGSRSGKNWCHRFTAGRRRAKLRLRGFKNDSGCKALRVDGRNCVPYNNLSLQPETHWPLHVRGEAKDFW
jgi:hypothetical protein